MIKTKKIDIGAISVGADSPLFVAAGPCVIENRDLLFQVGRKLLEVTRSLGLGFVLKASYDKANRTSIRSFRGPGYKDGLAMLAEVRRELGVPVMSDVHRIEEVEAAADVLDIIQIPAFLCRQTDLLRAAAETGKTINIKKGQFLAPWDMAHVIGKMTDAGNDRILLTERGVSFGYNNLVVDMRSLPIMRSFGFPVIFDATHSVQLPGGGQGCSGGDREYVAPLARAAVAAGVDGVFMEVHPDPDHALCDGPNSLALDGFPALLHRLREIDRLVKAPEASS